MIMLFAIPEVAKRLAVSQITLRRLVRFRRISFRHIGDRILFSEDDISDYLESIKVPVVSQQREANA
jgi:excisionase family DNA binding protein